MLLHDLQKYIEGQLSGASLPVDLLKIAKSIGYGHYVPKGPTKSLLGAPNSLFTLVVDAECCLDRLYGGFFSDWICGGQWNRMVQFLSVLIQTVQNNNIELAIFFNGALEKQRFREWTENQSVRRKHTNSVLRHISMKGTPPPKVWWLAPVALRTCLRMALRHLGIQVICTMDDHHQEVIAFCRENNYHGLLAEDSEYIIFDPPRYFSARQLKLTYKGSLETKEFILDEISKGLNLPRNYFCFLAALLSNFLLSEDDLHNFYATLIPGYDKNTMDERKTMEALIKFIVSRCDANNLRNTDAMAAQIFGALDDPRVSKFKEALQYFLSGTNHGFLTYQPFNRGAQNIGVRAGFSKISDRKDIANGSMKCEVNGDLEEAPIKLPPVPHEVTRTASERHQKGVMCPWICQILTHGEVKFSLCIQDENCTEFPNAFLFFKRIRQYVYAILFNYHHHSYMARKSKEDGQNCTEMPDIRIKEWFYTRSNPYNSPMVVEAVAINWAVPTVQRLWFGSVIDDKKRRLRAFLSCVCSDSPLMLHTAYVPQHLLIMATVLRYIMSMNDVVLLRKQELDAFLVTAFTPELTNADYLQELKLSILSARGCQLASFFMVGVEMSIFANDACGSPIPWLMCCPWLFFDGKLFHATLAKANKARNLMELCQGDVELMKKVERCREAIFEGIHPNFIQPPPLPLHGKMRPGGFGPGSNTPSYPCMNGRGGPRGRGRGGGRIQHPSSGSNSSLYSRGGQLQVAGVVVGSWGPNYGTGNPKNGNGPGYGHGEPGTDFFRGMENPARNQKQPNSRGRPSVLAKRRMIKGSKEPFASSARGRHQQMNHDRNPLNYSEDEYAMTNGNCEPPHHHHSNAYSTYNNVPYNPPSCNLPSNANNGSYNNAPNHFNSYHHQDMMQNHEAMNLPPPFQTQPNHHHHSVHHSVNHHHHQPPPPHQNLYGIHSNGYKSPDSGVNVSILE